jgi:peptidoglycan/LPS O-acetylase OafA/YrhL
LGTIRILLAFAVVSDHSVFGPIPGTHFIGGATAVQAFFVISGFFITLVLSENPAYASVPKFYASRYLRLWPMYFICAVPTLLLSSYDVFSFGSESTTYVDAFRRLDLFGRCFILFSNLTIFFQDWTLFLQADWLTGSLSFTPNFTTGTHPIVAQLLWDGAAWSLGIELIFYLIAPFVVRSPARAVLLTVASLTVRVIVARQQQMVGPWTYRFMPSELCMFGFGSLAYHFHVRAREWTPATQWRSVMVATGISGFLLLIVAIVFNAPRGGSWRSLSLISPFLLILIVTFVGPVFSLTKTNRLDRWLGDMSYPVYLVHIGVFSAMTLLGFQAGRITTTIYVAITTMFAAALLLLVDAPMARFRRSALSAQQTLVPSLGA